MPRQHRAGVLLPASLVIAAVVALGGSWPSASVPPSVDQPAAASGGPAKAAAIPSAVAAGEGGRPRPRKAEDERRPDEVDSRPNILLITTDDQNADDLRWMPRTRRLLGRQGVTFTDAVSAHPLCCPARAQIATGQYAHNNGVRHNHGVYGGYKTLRTEQTVATWLSDAGYRTGFVGKFLNEYPPSAPRPPGWSIWDPMVKYWYAYFGTTYARPGDERSDAYVTDALADRTDEYLRMLSDTGDPFFLWASHVAPHAKGVTPGVWEPPLAAPRHRSEAADVAAPSAVNPAFNGPPVGDAELVGQRGPWTREYIDQYYRQRARSLKAVDEAVAANLETLAELGELRNTYVFFTSDNGYLLGEHGLVGKSVLYRQALEIPLLVRGPTVRKGDLRPDPVILADLAATFVAIAGADPGLRLDGESLLPLLRTRKAPWRDTVLLLTGSERTWGAAPGWGYRGVRTARYTFGIDALTGAPLLFDRHQDPNEMHNVASEPSYQSVVAQLSRRTEALIGCKGASCNVTFGAVR